MEETNGSNSNTSAPLSTPNTEAAQTADSSKEGASNMADKEKRTRKTDEDVIVVRISGTAAVALKEAVEAATAKSGFAPRPGQVVEAALRAYTKSK